MCGEILINMRVESFINYFGILVEGGSIGMFGFYFLWY